VSEEGLPDGEQVTALADTIHEAWNTGPWHCNLDMVQQRLMARIAAHAVLSGRDEQVQP
jgi:hypothetical protein